MQDRVDAGCGSPESDPSPAEVSTQVSEDPLGEMPVGSGKVIVAGGEPAQAAVELPLPPELDVVDVADATELLAGLDVVEAVEAVDDPASEPDEPAEALDVVEGELELVCT